MEYFQIKTVGELRTLLEGVSDDCPIHKTGSMGDCPVGGEFAFRKVRRSKTDPHYFADTEDPIWKKNQFLEFEEEEIQILLVL